MKQWHYFYQGLRVSAQFPLPEWTAFGTMAPTAKPDVLISLHDGSAATEPRVPVPDWTPGDEFAFFAPGIGSFRITGGREIAVAPLPGIQTDALQPWLAGAAWGALCYQRGLLILHASSVGLGDGAIAFCGLAGSGKSTMAAHLHAQGYALVGDDLCRIEFPSDGPIRIHPSAPRLRLAKYALAGLSQKTEDFQAENGSPDRKINFWAQNRSIEPLPLRAIYLLGWGEWSLRRLTGAEALSRLLASATYRGELLHSLKRTGPHAHLCLELLRRVPIWDLTRPKESEAGHNIVRFITETKAFSLLV
jgi:hypothetical protein